MCALCASLLKRARDVGVSVEWHTGAPSELVAYVPHFQWASKHGKLLWRKTAYALRGPRPHQTVGFGEDPRDRERPQRGAAGLNADFEDEGVENEQ